MNSKAVVSVVFTVALTAAGSAFAQGRDPNVQNVQYQEPSMRGLIQEVQREHRREQRRDQREQNQAQRAQYYDRSGRGAGPNHRYYRGDRLPAEYRHRNYVVSDWRGHRLSAPPRDHHWVQSGSDYLLIAIATGVIAQLVLNN